MSSESIAGTGVASGVTGSTALVAIIGTLAAGALMIGLTAGTMSSLKSGAQARLDSALAARAAAVEPAEESDGEDSATGSRKHVESAVDNSDHDDAVDGSVADDQAKPAGESGVDSSTSVGVSQSGGDNLREASDGTLIDSEGNLYRRVGTIYDIEWGDTLSGISRDTGVSVDAIAQENDIRDVDLIYADSSITIP